MGRQKPYKSPSTMKRNYKRFISFLIKIKTKKPYLSISVLPQVSIHPRKPELSRQKCSLISIHPESPDLTVFYDKSVDIPPEKPPKPKLKIVPTSSTCDASSCQGRRRPCYGIYPANQFFLEGGELW